MPIIQVFPEAKTYRSIRGIYLDEIPLRGKTPFVYANFLTSLDGRIAVRQNGALTLPAALTSDNDLRLFLELRAQADCIITHGGYMRARAQGRLGDILAVGDDSPHGDLTQWRRDHAMPPQPAAVICSNTLEFPLPAELNPQNTIIASSADGDTRRRADYEKRGYRVIEAGRQRVTGRALLAQLDTLGFKRIYLCAGPELFESFAADACLQRLYLTISAQLLGHSEYLTMAPGARDLRRLHLAPQRMILDDSQERSQLFATFDCAHNAATTRAS